MVYEDFIHMKTQLPDGYGFEPNFLPDSMMDFQKHLTSWAIGKGRGALYTDCGTGKTLMALVWAENVARHTGGRVLFLTPLAVTQQIVAEGEKFGIECKRSHKGELHRICVTNYERLHMFKPDDFVGVVCDESAVLKNFKAKTKTDITVFTRKIPYRLLDTATPSPNDFHELGTSSEALGYLGYMDMLNKFFKNDLNNSATGRIGGQVIKWRLKGHAELPFWRWVCSWSRALRKPSDMGFSDEGFDLPPLTEQEHIVKTGGTLRNGMLFAVPAWGIKEQREERRKTINERCEYAASLVNDTGQPAVVWCHLNDEGDLLEKMIPDAIQVSGRDSDDRKEEKLTAFAQGRERVMVTKAVIGAWGLNLQHCNHSVSFPSHSFEQYYQSIRRFWRFGQLRPVQSDIVTTEGEIRVLENLQRKAKQADEMFNRMIECMNNVFRIDKNNIYTKKMEVPPWLLPIK
jgi:hypothetical protein